MKQNCAILVTLNVLKLNFIKIASETNSIPESVSKIRYLGLILSLQYLHFPLKNK